MSSSKSNGNPESSVCVNRISFNAAIATYFKGKEASKNVQKWDPKAVSEAIRMIEEYKAAPHSGRKRKAIHYNRAKTYDVVVDVDGVKELILKRKSTNKKPVIVPAYTRYYEILSEIHKNTDHVSEDRMCLEVENSYCIPRWAVSLFVQKCIFCQNKRGTRKRAVIVKPIVEIRFNSRGQVDLIDLQSVPDGEYRWIMYYQDQFTRFSFLRPLKNRNAVEVAEELFHIFTLFGYPQVLQSGKDDEFTASVLVELLEMWPECHIIHGRLKDTSLQGSVRSAIGDVKNCLRAWMSDNNTNSWSAGLMIVQWTRNTNWHSTLRKSPYAALFGKEPNRNFWHETLSNHEEDQISSNSDAFSDSECDEPDILNSVNSASPAHLVNTENSINVDARLVACPDKGTLLETVLNSDDNVTGSTVPHSHFEDEIPQCVNTDPKAQDSTRSSQVNHLKAERMCSICGRPITSEFYSILGNGVIRKPCSAHTSIEDERKNVAKGLKRSAEAMPEHPTRKFKNITVGDTVVIHLSKVDRDLFDSP